jgi:SAM-dependent methyltransferase
MEGYGPETYGDAIADIYDQWYGDLSETDDAVEALAALAQRAGTTRVLELGIGSGRLALPLAARGFDVAGIDTSQAMIDRLRTKEGGADIPVTVGDMAALDLSGVAAQTDQAFGLVFIAVNTFFLLTTADAQQRCLRRVRAELAPGGLFVLEAFVPTVDQPTNLVEARTVAVDHVVLTATRHDPVEQTVTSQYIELSESGIRMRPLVIRYAPVAELDAMAATAGLELVERWADWKGTPFTENANLHVSVYGAA